MSRHSRSVRLLGIAEDDLVGIITLIAEDKAAAAEKRALKIERQLAPGLRIHPSLGSIPVETDLAGLGYRYLVVENYLFFYTVTSESVLIHRIIHCARDYLGLLK
jgi:plasmid stabilization system protein ParE